MPVEPFTRNMGDGRVKVQSSWAKTIVVSLDDVPIGYFHPICSKKVVILLDMTTKVD